VFRKILIASHAERVTVAQDRLFVTFPPTTPLHVTFFRVMRPVVLPLQVKAALGLTGKWALAVGSHYLIGNQLSVPLVRVP